MFPHDENARYQADEEGEDCEDHKIKQFAYRCGSSRRRW
jgi:hypothetical protein